MYCRECGHENGADTRFCEACGKPLAQDAIRDKAAVQASQATAEPSPKIKKRKWGWMITGIIVAALCAAVFAYKEQIKAFLIPLAAPIFQDKVSAAVQRGEYGAAIELCQTWLTYAPQESQAYCRQAELLHRTGKGEKGLEVLLDGLAVMPRNEQILQEVNRHKQAMNPYRNSWKSIYRAFLTDYLEKCFTGTLDQNIEPGASIMLLDINFDGVPELLSQQYVGNAYGDVFLSVYTIKNGVVKLVREAVTGKIESLRTDNAQEGLCLYRNIETGDFSYFDFSEFGATVDFRTSTTQFGGLLSDQIGFTERFYVEGGLVKGNDTSGREHVEWEDDGMGYCYFAEGVNVPKTEYEAAYRAFFSKWVRVDWTPDWWEHTQYQDSFGMDRNFENILEYYKDAIMVMRYEVLKDREFDFPISKAIYAFNSESGNTDAIAAYAAYLQEVLIPQYGTAAQSAFGGKAVAQGDGMGTNPQTEIPYKESRVPIGILGASICDMDRDGTPEYAVILSERTGKDRFALRLRVYTLREGTVMELQYPGQAEQYSLTWYDGALPKRSGAMIAPTNDATYVCLELLRPAATLEAPHSLTAFEKRGNELYVLIELRVAATCGAWATTLPLGYAYPIQPDTTKAPNDGVWLMIGDENGFESHQDGRLFNTYYESPSLAASEVLSLVGLCFRSSLCTFPEKWSEIAFGEPGTLGTGVSTQMVHLRANLSKSVAYWEDHTDFHAMQQ